MKQFLIGVIVGGGLVINLNERYVAPVNIEITINKGTPPAKPGGPTA